MKSLIRNKGTLRKAIRTQCSQDILCILYNIHGAHYSWNTIRFIAVCYLFIFENGVGVGGGGWGRGGGGRCIKGHETKFTMCIPLH